MNDSLVGSGPDLLKSGVARAPLVASATVSASWVSFRYEQVWLGVAS